MLYVQSFEFRNFYMNSKTSTKKGATISFRLASLIKTNIVKSVRVKEQFLLQTANQYYINQAVSLNYYAHATRAKHGPPSIK